MTSRGRLALLWRYVRPQRAHVLGLVLLGFLPAALVALEPLAYKLLIDNAIGGEPLTGRAAAVLETFGIPTDPHSVVLVAAAFAFGATVVTYLLNDAVGLYTEWVGARMVHQAACDLFDKMQHLSLRFHAGSSRGDSLSRVTADTSSVYTAVSSLLISPALHLATIIVVTWSALRLDRGLTALILVLAPLVAALARWMSTRLKRQATRARRREVAVVSFVSQIVRSLPLVQAYTAERQNLRTFRGLTDRSLDTSRRVTVLDSGAEVAGAVAGAIGLALVTVVGGWRISRGELTVGDLVVFLAYARILDSSFRSLLALGRRVHLADVGLERMREVFACPDDVPEPQQPRHLVSTAGGASLEFEAVTFAYADDRHVLEDVSLSIGIGERVAIVGPTGAGKTTLVGLVSRLYDPSAGRVLMGGVDLREVPLQEVRSQVSVLRQEPLLLPISVADNIAIGRPDATRTEVEVAAELALAHDFIRGLPRGYDSIVGSEASFSGGERQRLAIARAFLKDAPVLVLDEPTSALDADSESLLVQSLERVSQGRTVLVIAHRLATVQEADRVLVLEAGRLIEVGSHEDLLEVDGLYARFHRLQSLEVHPA
jgi:ATP-binding cassette subfamily B protein